LVGAVPALAQNLLSSDPILYHHRTQYQAFVLPFVIAAAVTGYERAARRTRGWPVTVLVAAMILSLALAARTVNDLALARWWPTPAQRAARSVLAQVPVRASVSAQDPFVAHLSLRPLVFVFPMGIERSEYVLFNAATYPWRDSPDLTMEREGRTLTLSR